MYYAFIDTNIWIRAMSQGRPGCETELLKRLRVLVAGKVLTLVIPEVVSLELEGEMRNLHENLTRRFEDLKDVISKKAVWSEIEDAKLLVLRKLDALRKQKIQRWKLTYKRISDLLKSSGAVHIPLTPEILCRAKKLMIRGGFPGKSRDFDQDAAIIESLVIYFSDIKDPESILFFCSANHSDFAVELTATESRERRFALHPKLQECLPESRYFITLEELLAFDRGYESLPPPTNEEILEAMERAQDLGLECKYDLDSEEYRRAVCDLEELQELQRRQEYCTDVLLESPEDLRAKREDLVMDIQLLLGRCRKCVSWDDRSEYKLSQWIEFIPENMIPYTSLSNLLRIKKSLKRYLSIHKEMDAKRA